MTKLIGSIAVILATAGSLGGIAASAQAETSGPIVRDHRKKPIVRDHRKPNFCFGAISGYNCWRI